MPDNRIRILVRVPRDQASRLQAETRRRKKRGERGSESRNATIVALIDEALDLHWRTV
jgi:hypothetical protein